MLLADVNDAPPAQLRRDLLACCGSQEWVEAVLRGRPFDSRGQLLDLAERAVHQLSDAGLEQALAGHPRIGERPTSAGADADHARREQAGVAGADADVRARLLEANTAYEERFDRVFLIRAAGRGPEEILAEAKRRLRNDAGTERAEVLDQLAEITRLRLEGYLHP